MSSNEKIITNTENNSESATAQRSPASQGDRDLPFRPRPAGEESIPSPEERGGDDTSQTEKRAKLEKNKGIGTAHQSGDDKSQTEKRAKLEKNKEIGTAHQSGDEETEEEENPLVGTQPGFVFDKRIGRERKRIAMDDFTEEKYRRRAEEKGKKRKTKTE